MDSYNNDSVNMMKSRENFQQFESKLKMVISKCNKNNLVDRDNDTFKYEVRNATSVDHYLVDGGLHVYKFYNNNQAINYWISSKPIREKYEYVGLDSKKRIGEKYTGTSCFEYSVGGIGNSISLDGGNSYSVASFIGVLSPSSNGAYLRSDLVSTSGFGLTNSGSSLGFYKYNSEVSEFYRSGNLYEYVRNLGKVKLYEEEVQIVKDLQSTLDRIDELSLNREKDAQNKKSFLKSLLGLNKELDSKMNAFGNTKGR